MQVITDPAFAARENAAEMAGGTGASPLGATAAIELPPSDESVGKPSVEVRKLMTQFYEAASKGDFEFLDGLLSRRARVLWIGTDPHEWWESPEAVLEAWRTQTAELGSPAAITGGNATVWQHGEVAWVSDRPALRLPDGRSFPFRLTAVWVVEPEGWRIVQVHLSLGVLNESVLGSS
jgi:ketosteroid isomerase-like protein